MMWAGGDRGGLGTAFTEFFHAFRFCELRKLMWWAGPLIVRGWRWLAIN